MGFARDLRLLREKDGTPTYRELSTRVHYSTAALSEAASGRKLPSLAVTMAYVAACGGDTALWEDRWRRTAAELAAASPTTPPDDAERAPYVGLIAFQQEDSDRFFGRDTLVGELLARLRQRRFLGVFGASGCGKSSLLRAGVAARLAAERQVVVLTPGQHPLQECAVHLADVLGESPARLAAEFSASARNLHLRIREAAVASQSDVVLVVDQFEELFTLCTDERERAAFVDALVAATSDPASRTRVVLGVRADFLGHCGQHPALVSALRDGQVLVGPMTTEELRLAITGPAERAGYRVETALVARLVADAGRQSGMLPLVSHALLQTWARRQGKVMTLAAYEAIGGIEHALARSAEQLHQSMDTGQQDVAKEVFLRLTVLHEGPEDTKRRAARDELDRGDPNTAQVLDMLTEARLLTVGHDSVEIAHEALIRHWPRLRDWLDEDRAGHRLHRQLTDAAADWERHQRDDGLLYRGARLAAWQDRSLDQLNDTERAFLTGSRRAAEREHRSRRRRVRFAIGALTTATAVVTVLAVVALAMTVRADRERAQAIGRQLAADARAVLPRDPELGLLLAREAYATAPGSGTEAVLRQAVAGSHLRATLPGRTGAGGRPRPKVSVAFSFDGEHLATSDSSEHQVWDWRAGEVVRSAPRARADDIVPFPPKPVFGPDLRQVAEADRTGVVRVWDWARQDEPVMLPAHLNPSTSVAFSPDGQRVAGAAQYGAILLWHPAGDREPRVLQNPSGWVRAVAFSPDGQRLASTDSDGWVRVWDLASGAGPVLGRTSSSSRPQAVAFSPDGRHVATASTDGAVRVWGTAGAAEPLVLGSHAGTSTSIAYSADGRWLTSTGVDGTVRVWNARHVAAPLVLRGHHGTVTAAAFSPDSELVASVGTDGTTKVWAVDAVDDLTVLHDQRSPVWSVAASQDGRHVAGGAQDGSIHLYDLAEGRAPTMLSGDGRPVRHLTFSPDGTHLAATLDRPRDVDNVVWNTTDLAAPATELSGGPVAFNPRGDEIATCDTLQVTISRTDGSGERRRFPHYDSTVADAVVRVPLAWSPDGEHIAVISHDGVARLWNARSGGRTTVLPGRPGQSRALSFSPDGTYLASGGQDGAIHLWNTTTGENPTVLTGHEGRVSSASFSADGRHLVTTGDDATVRVWTMDSTTEPLVLGGFRASVEAVATLPDGRFATAHDDGTLRIWRCPACGTMGEVLTAATTRVTRELTPQERRTYLPATP